MKTLTQEIAELQQKKNLEMLQRNRAKKAKQQEDDRRKFIVGELFLSAFPEYKQLRPQQTNEGTKLEFVELEYFLAELAARRVVLEPLRKMAARRAMSMRSALMNSKQEVVK